MSSNTATLASVDKPLPTGVLEHPADGFGLAPGSTVRSALAAPSSDATSLLVFLRHFG